LTPGALFAVVHLLVAAIWLGAMLYSLTVAQPKVTRFFSDDRDREDFLTTLAHGNRWAVVGLIAVLVVTAAVVIAVSSGAVATGYAVALALYAVASAVFVNVSWRHWPARVFARPEELPRFRRQLRAQALAMLTLVAAAFVIALGVSVELR
jgi:putative copper export protein